MTVRPEQRFIWQELRPGLLESARRLAESDQYVLTHEGEETVLIDKALVQWMFLGDHYGDPTCGIIGPTQTWFLIGGEGLTYFDFTRGLQELWREPGKDSFLLRHSELMRWVHSMRLEGRQTVRILLDPWSSYASVWELDIEALALRKVADGPSLVDQPYRDDVAF